VLLYGGGENDHSDVACIASSHSIEGVSINSPESMLISVRGIRRRTVSVTYFSLNALMEDLSTTCVQFNPGSTSGEYENMMGRNLFS
jgi:hypothetical protein